MDEVWSWGRGARQFQRSNGYIIKDGWAGGLRGYQRRVEGVALSWRRRRPEGTTMAIAIGCGEAGTALKEKPEPYLTGCGDEVDDFGCFGDAPVLFPDIAYARSKGIGAGRNGLGRCR